MLDAVWFLGYIALSVKSFGKWLIGKHLEGSSRGLIEVIHRHLCGDIQETLYWEGNRCHGGNLNRVRIEYIFWATLCKYISLLLVFAITDCMKRLSDQFWLHETFVISITDSTKHLSDLVLTPWNICHIYYWLHEAFVRSITDFMKHLSYLLLTPWSIC
jgi:hypothetical protein